MKNPSLTATALLNAVAKITLVVSLGFTGSVGAQVLMLDFGSTPAAGADLTNSPYHTANSTFTGATWNTLDNADPGALTWADNTAATGITAAIGIGSATTGYATFTEINLGSNPSNVSALGSEIEDGIYAGSTPGRDGIFTSATAGNFSAVGLQIDGLATGTYDIYITARNTSARGHTQRIFAGKSADSGNFAYSGYSNQTLDYDGEVNFGTGAWTEELNYVKFSVSITSGEVLNIVSLGGSFQNRGFLNSVQIVSAIPEPSSYALLAGLVSVAAIAARRRRN